MTVIIQASSANAFAQTTEPQHLIYDVYAGGIHVLQAELEMDFPEEGRYDIFMSAYTGGFLGKLVPWRGSFESRGWRVNEEEITFRPEIHESIATWRGETDIKQYSYNKDGSFNAITITEHGKKPKTKQPDSELTRGTMDALSATLNVLHDIAEGAECGGSFDVFDGKRRFTQTFRHKADIDLASSRYNIYQGPAQICEVEIEPVAGKWYEKPRGWLSIQEQGRQRGSLPQVWIGQVSEGGPAVPVKILVKTQYGALFMHLAEYRKGDQVTQAEKRSEK